ncbi:polysaccharide biosynthesis C-terminal domain-containing protein [Enterococcus sp. BWB1-3]|uniref:lipopolysaccharide biosynthesis protein n=1 Tax=Enterococcus sp. BWB1-3 TaxID=2787713 RepID=UPI001921752C|nr:polysaccharide biosynthesis C-terminal domain-containing protein [Enterococcus sp. BWB1-3]MBL1228920.1 polysaccharide biosynthesis C-terminal domain-containing protein [Enterococcus sp. BWB1-3]
MNKYKKLLSNSLIFGIGNFGSKILILLMVPFYTFHMSTTSYGTADLITTTTNMLLPIATLSIHEATLRFVMDKEYENNIILSNSLFLGGMALTITLIFLLLIKIIFNVEYIGYMIGIVAVQAIQNILAQFTRGIGKVKIYAINGLLVSVFLVILNLLFIGEFNMNLYGYLLSIIISSFISIVFLIISSKEFFFCKYILDFQTTKRMLIFSFPLIPNSFMWWIINASSRYFILFFVGVSGNGIYAVATKIPTVLSIVQTIFFQAWQMSAIEEFNAEENKKFYTSVFDYFSKLMFIMTGVILVIVKPVIFTFLGDEYHIVWRYVSLLLLGVLFSSFSSFFGTTYIAAKKTKGVLVSSVLGGIVSVGINALFIPKIGIYGACFSMFLCFFIMWLYRVKDTKKFVDIHLYLKEIVLNCIFLLLNVSILYMSFSLVCEFFINLVILLVSILMNLLFIIKRKRENR